MSRYIDDTDASFRAVVRELFGLSGGTVAEQFVQLQAWQAGHPSRSAQQTHAQHLAALLKVLRVEHSVKRFKGCSRDEYGQVVWDVEVEFA